MSSGGIGFVIDRIFFACRSLLDSRDLRFGDIFGDLAGDRLSRAFSSDSGIRRRAVGWFEGRIVCCAGGSRSFRTALAQDSNVVREARNAAS